MPNLWLVADPEVQGVVAHVQELEPDILAVDSVQTLADVDLPSAPGSVSQVTECAHRLVRLAKEREMATLLVGHVTKDGALAGPRVLEHAVDTVRSTATATTPCGCCAPSSTASAPRRSSVCSR